MGGVVMSHIVDILIMLQGASSIGVLWAIMTIGVYITYRVLDYADLTVDGSFALGGAVAAKLIIGGTNPFLATLVAFIAGMLSGVVTGLLHTKLKIPALLSGILSMIALYSINIRVMGKANISLLKETTVFSVFESTGLSATSISLLVGLVCCIAVIILLYWFFGTELGSVIRATGNNENMIRAQGVNTDAMKIIALFLSNGFVAMSGALVTQSQKFADVGMGTGTIVIGLASVIIGEVLFGTRNFMNCLISLVLGSIVYRIIIAIVVRMGMESTDLKLFTAIIVALALALPVFKQKFSYSKKSLRRV
jgi:putative ABC transport system permease protein